MTGLSTAKSALRSSPSVALVKHHRSSSRQNKSQAGVSLLAVDPLSKQPRCGCAPSEAVLPDTTVAPSLSQAGSLRQHPPGCLDAPPGPGRAGQHQAYSNECLCGLPGRPPPWRHPACRRQTVGQLWPVTVLIMIVPFPAPRSCVLHRGWRPARARRRFLVR